MISVGSEVQILPGPPPFVWGRSSAGRAPALQAGGRRFEPDRLHSVPRATREQKFLERLNKARALPSTRWGWEAPDPHSTEWIAKARPLLGCRGEAPGLAFESSSQRRKQIRSCHAWRGRGGRTPCGGVRRGLCQGESGSGASLGASSVASLTGKRHASAGCPRLMASSFRGVVVRSRS